mmetsp:Transcript_26394/g.35158  ORF Transcript_26394/g.35158 Transcript_26394/m.35158 type:complete len:94 (-) Transcript_26394:1321-1602(-)
MNKTMHAYRHNVCKKKKHQSQTNQNNIAREKLHTYTQCSKCTIRALLIHATQVTSAPSVAIMVPYIALIELLIASSDSRSRREWQERPISRAE